MWPCKKHRGKFCLCGTQLWKKGPLPTDLWLPDEVMAHDEFQFKSFFENEWIDASDPTYKMTGIDMAQNPSFVGVAQFGVQKPPMDESDELLCKLYECFRGLQFVGQTRWEQEDAIGVN